MTDDRPPTILGHPAGLFLLSFVLILRTMARRWRAEGIGEADVPYGPSEPAPPPAAPTARGPE